MNRDMQSNDEPVTDYGYGYEVCTPATRGYGSIIDANRSSFDMMYAHDLLSFSTKGSLYNDDPAVDCSDPMPPDRLARKQRTFDRRGGAGHSTLLQSAVMAAMETQDDGSDDGVGMGIRAGRSRRDSLISLQESLATSHDGSATSPRKRARRFTRGAPTRGAPTASASDESDDEVAKASHLFLSMCNMQQEEDAPAEEGKDGSKKDFVRKAPIRRVSRRTSYDSRISDMSDLDTDFEDC